MNTPALLRLVTAAVTVLALTGCSSAEQSPRDQNGAVTEKNDSASVFDMNEGDCFDEPSEEAAEVETLPALPCSEPHDYEVFEVQPISGEKFPGEKAVTDLADQGCGKAFTSFVGISFDESGLELNYLYPTADSWDRDDREVTCLVADPDKKTSGSLEGSKR